MASGTQRNGVAQAEQAAAQQTVGLVSSIGYILAVSYPLLALSTGARALFQLFVRNDIVAYFPPTMSAVAAILYLVATVGFAYRRRWTWWLSMLTLGLESLLTVIIGTLSYIEPALIGRTVWRHFGEDYGYFPLFQPILGIIWLLWPATLRQYGFNTQVSGDHAAYDAGESTSKHS